MYYVDIKYVGLISGSLRNFKKKSNALWNFSCPICGDSVKKKSKARGFIYSRKNELFYKCHNCGLGTTFGKFLKQINQGLYDEYRLESYSAGAKKTSAPIEAPKIQIPKNRLPKSQLKNLKKISELSPTHPAKIYCDERRIPNENLSLLYYVDKFKKWTNELVPDKFDEKSLKYDEARLVIPFFNKDRDLIGYQGRTLDDDKIKYITIKLIEDEEMIFGMERVDINKYIYVVEGPIDSLFIDNAIAMSSSSINPNKGILPLQDKLIFVWDNQPRNKEICKIMNRFIEAGRKVCIWEKSIKEKDINEMVLAGFGDIKAIIDLCTFKDLTAKLVFNDWKQC